MLPRTWFGWAIYVVGAIVAILLGGAALVFFFLPRAELKAEFERRIEAEIGRDVAIAGDFGATFFPVLGFRATEVAVANVRGGTAPHLAEAEAVSAGIELIPLITRRQVILTRLVLTDPRIALEVDAQGRPNWYLAPARGEAPAPTPGGDDIHINDVELREVRIEGGQISYRDARDNGAWTIEEPRLRSSVESLDRPIDISGSFGFRGERVSIELNIANPRRIMLSQTSPVTMRIDGALLNARLEGEAAGVGEWFVGQAQANGTNLRAVSNWLGAPLPQAGGLGQFSVEGRLTTQQGRIAFENATLAVDAARGRGDFTLEQHGTRPYISGRLELPAFDINPFLFAASAPAATASAAGQATPTVSTAAEGLDMSQPWRREAIDLAALRSVDANLELTTGQFRVQRMVADSAMLSLVLNEGYLAATLHRLALYGGTGRGRVEVDARELDVRFAQELTAQNLRLQPFMRDAFGYQGLEGTGAVTLSWSGVGRTQGALVSSLDGRAELSVQNGALRGVDLGGVARTIQNAISGELINANARTRFSSFSGAFAMNNGVLATDNLRVVTSDLQIDGTGLIDVGLQS
ncbi:MAG: AsmA family protein, partial [Hyphomonadaceae bacterium]